MKELRQHAEQNNLSIAQVILANENVDSWQERGGGLCIHRKDYWPNGVGCEVWPQYPRPAGLREGGALEFLHFRAVLSGCI
jgi:hypothetical protein